jgi:hypothetical protein
VLGALGIECCASVGTGEGTGTVGRSDPGVVARGARRDASIGSARRDASIGIPEWNIVGTLMGATDLAARSAGRGASIGAPVWGMGSTLPGASMGTWRGGIDRHAGEGCVWHRRGFLGGITVGLPEAMLK